MHSCGIQFSEMPHVRAKCLLKEEMSIFSFDAQREVVKSRGIRRTPLRKVAL
jgi:hypothetical protein